MYAALRHSWLMVLCCGLGVSPAQPPPAAAPVFTAADVITLASAVTAALTRHPALAATHFELQAHRQEAAEAGLAPNPVLFGEVEEFGGTGQFAGTDAHSARVGISQELLLAGKRHKRHDLARTRARQVMLDRCDYVAQLNAIVARRFYNVFYLQQREQLLQENLQILTRSQKVVTKRVNSGEATPLDLPRTRIEVASARLQLQQCRQQLATARYALAMTWDETAPAFSRVTARYTAPPRYTRPQLHTALQQTPAWRRLALNADHARAALQLARAERIPNLELEAGVQHFNEIDEQAFFVGFSIPLPLIDQNQHGIAAARARQQQQHHENAASRTALLTAVHEAHHELILARESLAMLQREILPAAEEAYRAIRKAYRIGEADLLALLDARRVWLENRQQRLESLHQRELAHLALRRLLATGQLPATPAGDSQTGSTKGQDHVD